jgi:hypothetical protein
VLEDRRVPSLTPATGEILVGQAISGMSVDTTRHAVDLGAAVADAADGHFAVAW